MEKRRKKITVKKYETKKNMEKLSIKVKISLNK